MVKESKSRLYKATVVYKLFRDKDYYDFSDTYEIDEDYFYGEDDIYDYIVRDVLLVVGGGYSTKSIEKATVKINGKVVKEIDRSNQKQKLPTSANENVKDWYVEKYPTDELGLEIDKNVTFAYLFRGMARGDDIEDMLDVGDSIIRERVFGRMSEILGLDYDDIYYMSSGRTKELSDKCRNYIYGLYESKSRKSVNELYDYYLDRDESNNYKRRNSRNGYREVKPTRQKSFYGKAVTVDLANGGIALVSYNTMVCGYEVDESTGALEFKRYWGGYSTTTMNHINAFREEMSDDPISKAQWSKMPVDRAPRTTESKKIKKVKAVKSVVESNTKVIYGSKGYYKVTDLDNYNSYAMNANKIINCKDFESPEEIINYFNKWCGTTDSDFVIKTNESRKRHTSKVKAKRVNESEELARKYFVSLNKDYEKPYNIVRYFIMNDGNFVKNIIADSDEEAIKKFNKLYNIQEGYGYKYKPSRTKAREFAQAMSQIDDFCRENGISQSRSSDSYYFTIDGQDYRVSNHTVSASNRGAYNDFGEQVRDLYHPDGEDDDVIYITAGKTRIIDIYNNLKAGKKLDRRGNVI